MIRNKGFWLLDQLRGGPHKKDYEEIRFMVEQPESAQAKTLKKDYLNQILSHATAYASFYAPYSGLSIADFPTINKNQIRIQYDRFLAQSFLNQKSKKVQTSGSTATPFVCYQNQSKQKRTLADNLYFSEKAAYRVGTKLSYFRFWEAFQKKSKWLQWVQNIQPIEVFSLLEQKNLGKVITEIQNSKSKRSWLGYASAFVSICNYMDTHQIPPMPNRLRSAIAISEIFPKITKEAMHTYFGVRAVSRYSNIENGILAQQPADGNDYFVINTASYHIEIFNLHKEEPVPDGTIGRIVITDLFNYAMPLIRYDTGDLGSKGKINNLPVLHTLTGRRLDAILDTSGNMITFNLMFLLGNYPEIKQGQLIQKDKKQYVLKINGKIQPKTREQLLQALTKYLGQDANISLELVASIPLLSSGKFRVMVNEMLESRA